jgi:DNA polymerase-3 subunit chi
MKNIFFYILAESEPSDQTTFACRLTEKVYKQGRNIYINTNDQAHAELVSQQLWSLRDDAFIPHQFAGSDDKAPISIGFGEQGAAYSDVIINLASSVPECFTQFQRILEIVVQDEAILASTRLNYKHYKDKGYPLEYQDMRR